MGIFCISDWYKIISEDLYVDDSLSDYVIFEYVNNWIVTY